MILSYATEPVMIVLICENVLAGEGRAFGPTLQGGAPSIDCACVRAASLRACAAWYALSKLSA